MQIATTCCPSTSKIKMVPLIHLCSFSLSPKKVIKAILYYKKTSTNSTKKSSVLMFMFKGIVFSLENSNNNVWILKIIIIALIMYLTIRQEAFLKAVIYQATATNYTVHDRMLVINQNSWQILFSERIRADLQILCSK